jgi:NADH dehydrogenase FAD-containing subunit
MPGTQARVLPRVAIIGAGFGGLEAARKLARAPVEVTVIDRHNYHLFQPLLYQVATAALSPADIAEPIRVVLRHQGNATVLLDEVTGVDIAGRRIETRFGPAQSYDHLILATGSQYTYYGHDDWPRLAPGLKSIDDATLIRRRMLLAFEEAETVTDPVIRQRLLTFVLVGAGADRRRDGRSARRARSCNVVARFPPHQPADGAHPAGRGRAARAVGLP